MPFVDTRDITIRYIQPNALTTQTVIVREKVNSKTAIAPTLLVAAGIIFWVHGSHTRDAWFKGEEVTGQAITGLYIGLVGLICCCICAIGMCSASHSHDSETEDLPVDVNRADAFLEQNSSGTITTGFFNHRKINQPVTLAECTQESEVAADCRV